MSTIPKVCGADIELGNFILGQPPRSNGRGNGFEAARLLLRAIPGVLAGKRHEPSMVWVNPTGVVPSPSETVTPWDPGTSSVFDPQDWGRKFLPQNGGCVYIDLAHLELCMPEVLSAFDHLACWHAMLSIAQQGLQDANQGLPEGQKIKVLVNNSDGKGHSYGSHLNFLITRRSWHNIFRRKLHHMLFFASYLSSSILFTGSGKVGSECGQHDVDFQISQRAEFFQTLTGLQTTHHRSLINCRDESHASGELARLHVIFFDNTLCHGSSLLKVGVTQLILAMVEQQCVDATLLLEDPLLALRRWSADPDLQRTAYLVNGKRVRALDLQWALHERAAEFVHAGRVAELVPRAEEILALWEDTLEKLESDVSTLVGRLDWVLKRVALERAMEMRGLHWGSSELHYLDQVFHSLDPGEGLFWAYHRQGTLESYVSPEQVRRFVHEPPADTRAYTRAQLLRLGGEHIVSMDWDTVRFRLNGQDSWPSYMTLRMPDPLDFAREVTQGAFAEPGSFSELLDALGAEKGG
ncbi:MAG: proteasome accessory factor PafA2 family protein [Planctomycetota bacterium]